MKRGVFSVMALVAMLCAGYVLAGDHGKNRRRESGQGREGRALDNQAHASACGSCHFAYPPCLLPSGSWAGIMKGLADHFGSPVVLAPDAEKEIGEYLAANAADRVGGKRAGKMLRGLDGQTPSRVTETPYMVHKHRGLDPAALARPSVGGLGNCPACHPGAARGDFDDDRVSIPR